MIRAICIDRKIIAWLVTVLLVVCTGSSCTGVLFQPLKRHYFTPGVVDVKYEDIYIESDKGLQLHGWKLLTQQQKKGAVLFLHGNGENISTHFANLYWLTEYGYDGYIFDYRGYGKSEGLPEIDGVMRDVNAMLDHVVTHTASDQQIIVIGHSMGGALAIYAVSAYDSKHSLTALVTVEAFSDYRVITRDVLATSWLTWWLQWPVSLTIDNSYSPVEVVGDITPLPILIMHSRNDLVVPFYHAMRLYEAANLPKQFIEIDSDHSHVFNATSNRQLLVEYLQSIR
jgi:alpha-beta hydrolase superfamily lysophospholipase